MYYPESNVLVPKSADPLSRTPAYKSISVEIVPEHGREFAGGRQGLAEEGELAVVR